MDRWIRGAVAAGAVSLLRAVEAAAQDTVSAGNGGVATASANGGAVSTGDINSGGNVGCAIGIGDTYGPDPIVNGCDIVNSTALGVSVNGGTGIADASGGSYNIAFVS